MKATTAQLRASISLSLLFIAVYGGCNWITARRSDVGVLCFEWEHRIPFVASMILPYMSLDLFFVAAPFLCADERELGTFVRRVSFAIIVAGFCFLLFPLRFAFIRPKAHGALGAVFDAFRSVDAPYNLFPSLHITLRTILAELYGRHTRGGIRLASQVWFSLIGFSAVLTYQHHIADVAGGFALATVTLCLFTGEPRQKEFALKYFNVPGRIAVAACYAAGTLAMSGLAVLAWPWTAIFFWPALSLAVVTAAYCGAGPEIFRKREGCLPLNRRILLAPYLIGQWLSLMYYRRQCRPWDMVIPGVWMGRALTDEEAAEALRQGVTSVLDLTAEFSESSPFLEITRRHIPILDLTRPTQDQLLEAVAFIAEQSTRGTAYVHCKAGYSRSAAVVGAYLLAHGSAASVEEAVHLLRIARPSVVVRPEAWEAMREFAGLYSLTPSASAPLSSHA